MAKERADRNDKDVNNLGPGGIFGRSRAWARLVFQPSWVWAGLLLPPFVMSVLPAAIVNYIIPTGTTWPVELVTFSLTQESEAFARHINHRIVYAAMICFHVTLCLCLIALFWLRLRDLPRLLRHRGYVTMAIQALLFFAIGQSSYWQNSKLYELSVINIRDIFHKTCIFHDIIFDISCSDPVPTVFTRLYYFVYIPQFFSLGAVIVAMAVAISVFGNLRQSTETEWRERFVAGMNSLQICFFGLSAVLVSSTITAVLFFQFPANLAVPANLATADVAIAKTTATAVSEYARALTVIWGTVYTLVLIVFFAFAAFNVGSLIQKHAQSSDSPAEFGQWLVEKALVSPMKLISGFAAMLAPVLIGAMGNLIKFMPGG